MKLLKWSVILLGAVSNVSTASKPRANVELALVSSKIEDYGSGGAKKIIGTFRLQNRARFDLCIMRDITLNVLSPYLQVSLEGRHSSLGGGAEIPNPPKSTEIMRLAPGRLIYIDRVVVYTGIRESAGGKLARVYTFVAWCGNNRQFKIETKRFKIPTSP
jgi:hypothetical protein